MKESGLHKETMDENLKKMGEDEFINKFLKEDKNEEVKNKEEVKKEIKKKLKEVLDVIDKQRSKVGDILRVLDEGKDPEGTSLKLTSICLIHSAVMKKEEVSGEWMYSKIDQIKNLAAKTEFGLFPDMLKEIMYPTMSYLTTQDIEKIVILGSSLKKEMKEENMDPYEEMNKKLRERVVDMEKKGIVLKEGKKSKLGFPELGLVVKSRMLDKKTRVWPCPVEGCFKAYKTSRSCDSHVNIHMGYEYGPCDKCGYTNSHLDSYKKHKCFSNLEEKCGRKCKVPLSATMGSSVEKK